MVEGTGEAEGIKYSFIPDVDNVIQVDTDRIPIGLSIGEGGFYTITTPEGQQYKVTPAPKDPIAFSEAIGGGKVIVGKRGDVMMELAISTRRGDTRRVMIFDPFIKPPSNDLCIENARKEIVCDFDKAPEHLRPGLHIFRRTNRKIQIELGNVIYNDGSSQNIMPTLLLPYVFIKEAFKFEGVENVGFNANGTFYVIHKGETYLIIPNFEVQNKEVTAEVQPSIEINGKQLKYIVPLEILEDNNQRHEVLIFNPLIELAPDDMCVEPELGIIVCRFD